MFLALLLLTTTTPGAETPAPRYFEAGPRIDFFKSLRSPGVLAPLKTRRKFASFLRKHKVPGKLIPGFITLYRVLARADPADAEELSHILPTIVRFLADGRGVILDRRSGHYYGMTPTGEDGPPRNIAVTEHAARLGRLLLSKTLAHEFQHVYDQYVQRAWPREALEARGQKAALLYLRILKKSKPAGYAKLRRGKSYEARDILREAEDCFTALAKGPSMFVRALGSGRCRKKIPESMALSHFSLKAALDQKTGEPARLKILISAKEREKLAVADLRRRIQLFGPNRGVNPRGESAMELDILESDLTAAKKRLRDYADRVLFKEALIGRVTAELEWLKDREGAEAVYDLRLAVDSALLD